MKTETDILIQISALEYELSQALKGGKPHLSYTLRIQSQIDILNWVLGG